MSRKSGYPKAKIGAIFVAQLITLSAARFAVAQTSGEHEPRPPRLALMWLDPHQLFTMGADRVGEHVRAVFEEIGVDVEWKMGTVEVPNKPSTVARGVRVLLVKSEPVTWGLHREAMGVVLGKSVPQSAVYVFFPSSVRTAGYKPEVLKNRMLSEQEKRDLAITLGRVVVHEVFHAVAPALPHAEDGVMSAKLGQRFLMNQKAGIHPRWAAVFRQELAGQTSEETAPLPTEGMQP